jgi:hypothetical protein
VDNQRTDGPEGGAASEEMGLDREESVSLAHEAGRRDAIYIFEAMGLQVCSGEDAFATLMILLWAAFACAGPQGGQKWTGQVQVVRHPPKRPLLSKKL